MKRKTPIKIIPGRSVGMREPELGLKELGLKKITLGKGQFKEVGIIEKLKLRLSILYVRGH